MRPVLLVVGTRPEGIKMAPVYLALKEAGVPTIMCATSQHDVLLMQALSVFSIIPDIDLKIMKDGQDLFHITIATLKELKNIIAHYNPSVILVQGDTTTAMAAGLAGFYTHTPVGHVEAGLRTGDMQAPYPEEFNRVTLGHIAQHHFAPTPLAIANLLAEGKQREHIVHTGNTIVDALRIIESKLQAGLITPHSKVMHFYTTAHTQNDKTLLFTMHRRESFGLSMHNLFKTLADYAQSHPTLSILFPFHPNPNVLEALENNNIMHIKTITLLPALSYTDLVYALLHSDVIATDSGGIQEEAVSLGKKVIVLREKSERMEGAWSGYATLVGFDTQRFAKILTNYIHNTQTNEKQNIYGDGFAAQKIVSYLMHYYHDYKHLIPTITTHHHTSKEYCS